MTPQQRRRYNKGIQRRRLKKDAASRKAARKNHVRADNRPAEDDPVYQKLLRERTEQ